ncbi:MAG TPA: DUF2085 domain-containing protein [Pyrinomonadaceae bacterium]
MRAAVESYVAQCAPGGAAGARARWAWALTLAGACAWLALVVCAPLARAAGHETLAELLYHPFGLVCHQQPARSYWLAGAPLAVCARCLGVYAGFALGVLCYPLVRPLARADVPARRWLVLALVPTGVDFLLGVTGLWANTHASRALTGALLGAAASFYVVPGLVGLTLRLRRGRRGVGYVVTS